MERDGLLESRTLTLPADMKQIAFNGDLVITDNLELDHAISGFEDRPTYLSFFTFFFCVEGKVSIRVNLQELCVEKNSILLLPRWAIVDKVKVSDNSRLGILFFSEFDDYDLLSINNPGNMLRRETGRGPLLIKLRRESMSHVVEVYKLLRSAIEDKQLRRKEEIVSNYLHVIGTYLVNDLEEERRKTLVLSTLRHEMIAQQFHSLVCQNFAKHRDISFYAEQLGMSAKNLGIIVKKTSGRNPSEWIRDLTVLNAQAMLINGNYNIQKISDALCFTHQSAFSRYFKENVGCGPFQYRKEKCLDVTSLGI